MVRDSSVLDFEIVKRRGCNLIKEIRGVCKLGIMKIVW